MGKFKEGQKLFCTKGDWLNGNGITNFQTPEKDEIVTVKDIREHEGHTLLSFEEYHPDVYYPAKYFKPQFHLFSMDVIKSLQITK